MTRHRDFDAARAEHVGDPLTFRLAGRDFTIERIPAGPLLELSAQSDQEGAAAMAAFARFLGVLVVPDQRDELRNALDEVELQTVLEIVQWVVGEATARPLARPSSSPVVPSPDSPQSKLARASEGWTLSQ